MRCGMHTQNYPRTVVGLPQTNCPRPQKQYTRRRHTNQDIVRYVHTLRIQYTLSETNLSRSAEQQVLRVSLLCWNCLRVEETDLKKRERERIESRFVLLACKVANALAQVQGKNRG